MGKQIITDFYSGYEGEGEIVFYHRSSEENIGSYKLSMWVAYFDEIITRIKPNRQGFWEGIPYYYHLHTGFYDKENWECKDKEFFLAQLKMIDTNQLGANTKLVHREMIKMLEKSIDQGQRLFIEYI